MWYIGPTLKCEMEGNGKPFDRALFGCNCVGSDI